MMQFLVRISATGALYLVAAENAEDDVYRVVGRDVLNMVGTDEPSFDTGNVDIDVLELKPVRRCKKVIFPGDDAATLVRPSVGKHDGKSVYRITVNGEQFHETSRISYERICELAGYNQGEVVSVIWGRIGDNAGGVLSKGMELALSDDNTYFNACITNSA